MTGLTLYDPPMCCPTGICGTRVGHRLVDLAADAGRRVLPVSTGPASNVGQVFGQAIGNTATPIAARAVTEGPEIARVRDLSARHAVVPMLAEDPVGADRLRALVGATPQTLTEKETADVSL